MQRSELKNGQHTAPLEQAKRDPAAEIVKPIVISFFTHVYTIPQYL
jgi:hypothetical protein